MIVESRIILLFPALFLLSAALTWRIRIYCIAHGIVDVPNARSSHSRVVARGGGIGFSFLFLATVLALGIAGAVPGRITVALVGAGSLVVLTGWADDRSSLSRSVRFALHLLAGVWTVFWFGSIPPIPLGLVELDWQWAAAPLIVLCIAWMLNLYNFMDGTDGIAAVEVLTVAGISGALCALAGLTTIACVYWILGSAAAGFLVWNWPPARIFMGDAGSGFLGYILAALAYWAWTMDGRLLWPCAILVAAFTADATTTLLLRMAAGEKWYEPHRSHAYQRLARRSNHRRVALSVLVVNLAVLGPAAYAAWIRPAFGFSLFLAANVVLAAVVVLIRRRGE
jgi:Fuc2NAc and GlcNAc transferase